jgi:3-dehydroquinate dehydratase-1
MPLRLGSLDLGPVPRIAVPLADTDLEAGADRIRRLADIAELRIDTFSALEPGPVVAAVERARELGVPRIATVRSVAEGGVADLPDDHRWALFDAVAPLVDAIDVELQAPICDRVVALAKRHQKLAIVSHHDFAATPIESDLAGIAARAAQQGADAVKIAAYAAAPSDLDRLLDLLRARRASGAIIIALGPRGVASRVFFPLFGSLISYGFLHAANAPGQLALEDLYDELHRYSPEFAAAHEPRDGGRSA